MSVSAILEVVKRKSSKQDDEYKRLMRDLGDDKPNGTAADEASAVPSQEPIDVAPDKVQAIMDNARRQLAERVARVASGVAPTAAVGNIKEEVDKAARQAALQAKINATLKGLSLPEATVTPAEPASTSEATIAAGYTLTATGDMVDRKTGQKIEMHRHQPTLMANLRDKRRHDPSTLSTSGAGKLPIDLPIGATARSIGTIEKDEVKFVDPRLRLKSAQRSRRPTFKFNEAGKFEKIGRQMRTKAQLDRLQNEIVNQAKKSGLQTAAKLAAVLPRAGQHEETVPDIEWWDQIILRETDYSVIGQLSEENLEQQVQGITELVQHPMTVQRPVEPKEVEIPIFLTKRERHKIRRQARQERQREEHEKIRLGLIPPPEPKVRIANLMRVLGNDAIQDPSKVEAYVRKQMAKRQKQHRDANASRQLTAQQRRDKKRAKLSEDTSQGVFVAIYRLRDLSNPQKKFKIEKNAKQRCLTGLMCLYRDCNVVVVEGGRKNQAKFKRLMMHRIQWGEDILKFTKTQDETEPEYNVCELVWEGVVKERSFGDITYKNCPTESFAREQFRKRSVEHYWDLAFRGTAITSSTVVPALCNEPKQETEVKSEPMDVAEDDTTAPAAAQLEQPKSEPMDSAEADAPTT